MNIRILIVDDHQIMRNGLSSLLEKQPDIKVVANAEDGATAIRTVREVPLDVVIMDIGMPNMNGIEATRSILALRMNVKVIALSMHSDRRFVAEVLKAGAAGYLLKDCAFDELAIAIRAVMANQVYLSPQIADVVVQNYLVHPVPVGRSAFGAITPRERQVLQLLAEGKTTKNIAAILNVSVKTIETHRQQTMTKLDIHSVAELTKYAIREGLTTLDR